MAPHDGGMSGIPFGSIRGTYMQRLGRVSHVPGGIVFRSATGNAPHRPQSRQQERNDWITFHFCGYTNEVQCRSQMFRSAPVDFGVILLRYSAVEDVPPCKQTADTGYPARARSTIPQLSYHRDSSFSPRERFVL